MERKAKTREIKKKCYTFLCCAESDNNISLLNTVALHVYFTSTIYTALKIALALSLTHKKETTKFLSRLNYKLLQLYWLFSFDLPTVSRELVCVVLHILRFSFTTMLKGEIKSTHCYVSVQDTLSVEDTKLTPRTCLWKTGLCGHKRVSIDSLLRRSHQVIAKLDEI